MFQRNTKQNSRKLQNDVSVKTLLNTKGAMACSYDEIETKHPKSASFVGKRHHYHLHI